MIVYEHNDLLQKLIEHRVQPLYIGDLFAVVQMSSGLLGLCVEDDDYYHLQTQFDAFWLKDLADVAERAHRVLHTNADPDSSALSPV